LAAGLAAVGAVTAYLLAGTGWGVAGAAVGAITGSFAPSVYDELTARRARREELGRTFAKRPPRSWARLLDPQRAVVGFVGREDELTGLTAWCEDDSAARLRLVTGPGGVGKTRLAVELSTRMRQLGWICDRIADGAEADAIAALRAVTRGRALLVVDYAETRVGLPQLLAALASDEGDGVRVLLQARSVGDWWDRLGVSDPVVWDLVEAARQAELSLSPVIAAGLPDAEIIASAVRSFAHVLDLPERAVEIYGDRGTGQARVLDLHAAALVAVLADPGAGPVQVDIRTVLSELLRHEQHYWYETASVLGLTRNGDGVTALVLRQVAAAACLLGAATQGEAHALASRIPGVSPSSKITEWLRVLYPPDLQQAEWIGSVQPDRLAELHVMRELAEAPQLGQACLTSLDARQALRAVTLLARASSDFPEAEDLLRETLPAVADLIAEMRAPEETLTAIFNSIPYPTVVLAPAAAAFAQQISSRLSAGTDPAVRARWLQILSVRLSELGRNADALPPAEQAVSIRRELAASAERHRGGLASSLDNLGIRLSELGRPADALPLTEQAVAIYRELAAARPGRYRRDLAGSLSNLGVRYSELGHTADAIPPTEEAITINRELATAEPDRYLVELATYLSNLSDYYSELGHTADAIAPTEEAITIRRELTAASPDSYRPQLASALEKLGARFSELGRPADALSASEEALAIYRELDAASPGPYRRDLAISLCNLSVRLSESGRPADALPLAEQAVAICRELTTGPVGYGAELAGSLDVLGARYAQVGRPAHALEPVEEAAAIFRELAAGNPDRYRPDLATALHHLGGYYSALGRPAEALLPYEEAVAIRGELAVGNPRRYQPGFATSLSKLSLRYAALGRLTDAVSPAQQAVAVYRELAAEFPDRYRPNLAGALNNLGRRLSELNRHAAALPPTEEAVAIHRQLAAASPSDHRLEFASSLENLGSQFAKLGRHADALPPTEEAVAIYRELVTTEPSRYQSFLAPCLNNLGVRYMALDRPADALAPTEEAVAIYRGLAAANSSRYRPYLAQSLDNLVGIATVLGHDTTASAARQEAAELSR
jgi:tetratricopeptide (TPR) repeat protein